jgi:hypothetical protein
MEGNMIGMVVRLGTDVEKIGRDKIRALNKATATAIQVEAFRLRKEAKAALRKGELGLRLTTPLRKKDGKTLRRKPKAPLKKFAKGVIYKMDKKNLIAEVGFVGTSAGASWQAKVLEKSIPGYRILFTDAVKDRLHKMGIHLKKETRAADVPARDVMGAFLKQQTEARIMTNIENNITRKLKGERI